MNAKQKLFEQYAIVIEMNANGSADSDMPMPQSALMSCAHGMREAALGHARYEVLRVLNPKDFAELWSCALLGRNFDELVDELVKAKNES